MSQLYGYGRSYPILSSKKHGNKLVCTKLLKTLESLLPRRGMRNAAVSIGDTPIIIVGHDRGARICHRLAVDVSHDIDPLLNIVGAMFLDIVPTLVQFQSFSTPSASVGTFHWPFLANDKLAFDMIKAYGGAKWTKMCIDRWAGKDKDSLAKLKSDDAVEIYSRFFEKDTVIQASCNDYRAGADEDFKQQEKEQNLKKPKKIDIDVSVLFSGDYLGKRYDVKKVWEEWMGKGELEVQEIAGVGHFIAEEKPEETAAAIVKFYEKF